MPSNHDGSILLRVIDQVRGGAHSARKLTQPVAESSCLGATDHQHQVRYPPPKLTDRVLDGFEVGRSSISSLAAPDISGNFSRRRVDHFGGVIPLERRGCGFDECPAPTGR